MKKAFKILTLLLALTLLLSAFALYTFAGNTAEERGTPSDVTSETPTAAEELSGKYYVVYQSEADFLADIEEGVIDGIVEGTSVLVTKFGGDSATLTLPLAANNKTAYDNTTYYYYLLEDVTYSATSNNVMAKNAQTLTINCGGKTVNWSGTLTLGNSTATVLKDGIFATVKNGRLITTTGSGQVFTNRQGSTLTFVDMYIDQTGGVAAFFQDGGGNFYFTNCTIVSGSRTFINQRNSWTNNCTCATHAASEGKLKCKWVFDNVTVNGGIFYKYNVAKKDNADMAAYIDIEIKNSRFAPNDFFYLQPNLSVPVENGVNIKIHDGTLGLSEDIFETYTNVSVSYIDTNGEPYGKLMPEETVIGDVTYAYKVKSADIKANFYDSDGTLLGSGGYFAGDIPEFALPTGEKFFVGEGNLPYISKAAGWNPDAESDDYLTVLPAITEDTDYYAIYKASPAAYAEYTSEQAYKNGEAPKMAWGDPDGLTASIFASFAEGAYVVLFEDLTYSENARIQHYKNGITLDLNGKTFYKTGTDNNCRFITPDLLGETLTIKNGKVDSVRQNLVYSAASTNVESTGTTSCQGIVIFENVEIKMSGGVVFDLRSGGVVLKGGSIESDTNIATLGNGNLTGEVILTLYGTQVTTTAETEDKSMFALIYHPNNPYLDSKGNDLGDPYTRPVITVARYDEDGKDWGTPVIDCSFFVRGNNANAVDDLNPESYTVVNVSDAKIKNTNHVISFAANPTFKNGETGAAIDMEYKGSYTFTNTYFGSNAPLSSEELPGDVYFGEGEAALRVYGEDGYSYYVGKYENDLSVNLTLYTSFDMNLYIPVSTENVRVTVDGVTLFDVTDPANNLTGEPITVGGQQYYLLTYKGITAPTAAKAISINVASYNPDGRLVEFTVNYSVAEYCSDILEKSEVELGSEVSYEIKALMRDTLAYVKAAYGYFVTDTSAVADEIALLERLTEKYPADEAGEITGDNTEIGTELSAYVISAQFELQNVIKLKLNLASTDVNLTVLVDGTEYALERVEGEAVARVSLRASDLVKVITITAEGASGTYSFATYAKGVWNESDANLCNILSALNAYASSADKLRAKVEALKA